MAAPVAKDSTKYRPFRMVVWAIYIGFSVIFSLAITLNVVSSTLKMTPDRPPPSISMLDPAECTSAARALWSELDARRKTMSEVKPARRADVVWSSFRIDWLTRAHETESRCTRESEDRKAQKKIFRELDSLMDLYTTHAVQFAGEVGPTIDALNADLEAAK